MVFFIMGSDATYYVSVGDLNALGNHISVEKEARYCTIYISDLLEDSAYLIVNGLGTF